MQRFTRSLPKTCIATTQWRLEFIYPGVVQLIERVVWDHQVARLSRVTRTSKGSIKSCELLCFFGTLQQRMYLYNF